MRAVALISLATGAVLDFSFAPFTGKGTGEASLLRGMLGTLKSGDVVVADRYYPSFFMVNEMLNRGIDMVSVSHVLRKVDFSTGTQLGECDHIAEWPKTVRPNWMTTEEYAALPDTIRVREFAIDIEDREGGKERAIVVSTITDPSVPKEELSDLYWRRWNCELDLRSLKKSMHLDVLRCKTPEMVEKEIFCHLLAYNLLRGTMTESAKRNGVTPRQLSVKGAMQAIESFTPAMMATDSGDVLYNALLTTVAAHRVGNRPGRQEPRMLKRRPGWTILLKMPRHKYHRRLNSEAASLR
jgi:putative transposase